MVCDVDTIHEEEEEKQEIQDADCDWMPMEPGSAAVYSNNNLVSPSGEPLQSQTQSPPPVPADATEEIHVVASPWIHSISIGCIQLGALLRRNFQLKARTLPSTLMELVTPVLIMLILVAAYQLSEQETHEAAHYADDWHIEFPGSFAIQ